VICDRYEIVVVPFPFTDRATAKRRPAVVLSAQNFTNLSGNTLLAMITSSQVAPWPLDLAFDFGAAGLRKPCKIRFKLFTLDHRLILNVIGKLHDVDRRSVQTTLKRLLGI
jgi:mRNA interferase MazF